MMKKLHLPFAFTMALLIVFAISSGTALAASTDSALSNNTVNASDLIYCTGSDCNQYKAGATHCIDNFHLVQDTPVYNQGIQVGSQRFWYSTTCSTYWMQVYATDCTNISQFGVAIYGMSTGGEINDFGLEGGCSLSGRMYYSQSEGVEGDGQIFFTAGESVSTPGTGQFFPPS
jgi:hypothetical protein